MKKQVKKISILQTSKVIALVYVVMSAIFIIPLSLIVGSQSGFPFNGLMILFLPVLYGVLGFIGAVFFCFIYNLIAKKAGGIEVEVG